MRLAKFCLKLSCSQLPLSPPLPPRYACTDPKKSVRQLDTSEFSATLNVTCGEDGAWSMQNLDDYECLGEGDLLSQPILPVCV